MLPWPAVTAPPVGSASGAMVVIEVVVVGTGGARAVFVDEGVVVGTGGAGAVLVDGGVDEAGVVVSAGAGCCKSNRQPAKIDKA